MINERSSSMEIVSSFHERFMQALEESGLKPTELAQKAGITRADVSKYMHGKYKPGNIKLLKLSQALNVDVLWLMGFDVPKHESDEHKRMRDEINNKLAHLSDENLSKVKRFIEEFLD